MSSADQDRLVRTAGNVPRNGALQTEIGASEIALVQSNFDDDTLRLQSVQEKARTRPEETLFPMQKARFGVQHMV